MMVRGIDFFFLQYSNTQGYCYQFRILRNLRMDIKDRLEEYSQSVEIDILNAIQSSKAKLSLIRNIYEKPLHSFPHLTCTQQKKIL